MNRMAAVLLVVIGAGWPNLLLASEEGAPQQPTARERLNQVLNSEGGVQVYKDSKGNVESTINLPDGEQIITVQPPQSPSMNLGPPLQLNGRPLVFPPPPPVPAQPPPPDFPQRAR